MIYFGEGSDWNYETDGIPMDSCFIEECPHAAVAKNTAEVSPATGEQSLGGIFTIMMLLLICLIAIGGKK